MLLRLVGVLSALAAYQTLLLALGWLRLEPELAVGQSLVTAGTIGAAAGISVGGVPDGLVGRPFSAVNNHRFLAFHGNQSLALQVGKDAARHLP